MTPEAQQIKIAEACPDLFEVHQTWRGPEGGGFRTFLTKKGEGVIGEEIDPLSDLNAAIQLCDILREQGWMFKTYGFPEAKTLWVAEFTHENKKAPIVVGGRVLALAICEGFLRALSLWDDSK